jgi:hypothetical protein
VNTIVVGRQVVGSTVPRSIAERSMVLSEIARQPLLGVDFTQEADGRWVFAGASPKPDLRLGGNELLDALTLSLQEGSS